MTTPNGGVRMSKDVARARLVLLSDDAELGDRPASISVGKRPLSFNPVSVYRRTSELSPSQPSQKRPRLTVEEEFRCHFCPAKCPSWKDFQSHLIREPGGIQLFACHLCYCAFFSRERLSQHSCQAASEWAVAAGGAVIVKTAYQLIICGGCGLQLPLWMDGMKEAYKSLIESHLCDRLVGVTIFTVTRMVTPPGERSPFAIHVTPNLTRIPLSCWGCHEPFHSWAQILLHLQSCPPEDPQVRQGILSIRELSGGAEQDDVIAFLASMKPEYQPKKGPAPTSREYEMVTCDLCGARVSSWDFNREHDCAVEYTRRLWDEGSGGLVKCPSVALEPLVPLAWTGVESASESLLSDLVRVFAQKVALDSGAAAKAGIRSWKDAARLDQLSTIHLCTLCALLFPDSASCGAHVQLSHPNMYDASKLLGSQLACPYCTPEPTKWCSLEAFCRHTKIAHNKAIQPIPLPPPSKAKKSFNPRVLKTALSIDPNRYRHLQPPKSGGTSVKTPIGIGTIICPVCQVAVAVNSSTISIKPVQQHVKRQHLLVCLRCNAAFTSQSKLNLHSSSCRKTRSTDLRLSCSVAACCFFTSAPLAYYEHLISVHWNVFSFDKASGQMSERREVAGLTPRTYQQRLLPLNRVTRVSCGQCSYSAESETVLAAHYRQAHDVGRRLNCPICVVKRFESEELLRNHLLSLHRVGERLVCPFDCGEKGFSSSLDVIQHVLFTCNKTHSAQCQICGEIQRNSDILRVHKMTVHKTFISWCETCGHLFHKTDEIGRMACEQSHKDQTPALEVIEPDNNNSTICVSSDEGPGLEVIEPEECIQIPQVPKAESPTDQEPREKSSADEEDDDIAILEQPDEPSMSKKGTDEDRAKNEACISCSMRFKTKVALQEHMKTHSFDAGYTTDLVLPVPLDTVVWVCRLCSLAYEEYDTFKTHSDRHGSSRSCTLCSALCFTEGQLKIHMEAHEKKQILFCCFQCREAYAEESLLFYHMAYSTNSHGNLHLIWFCKTCGHGSNSKGAVRDHIRFAHFNYQHQVGNSISIERTLGVTCHRKLHFQPKNANQYAAIVATQKLEIPGECVHRSFMSYNETLALCNRCGTTMPATKYFMENPEIRRLGKIELELRSETQAIGKLLVSTGLESATAGQSNSNHTGQTATSSRIVLPPRSSAPRSTLVAALRQPPPSSQPQATVAALRHPSTVQRPNSLLFVPVAQAVFLPVQNAQRVPRPNILSSRLGPRLLQPSASAPRAQAPRPTVPRQQAPSQPAPIAPAPPPAQHKCPTCHQTFANRAPLKVHQLKHNLDPVFCLDCGSSFPTADQYALHRPQTHPNKLPVMELACPGLDCERVLGSTEDLRKHVLNCFGIPSEAKCHTCQVKFAGPAALNQHLRVFNHQLQGSDETGNQSVSQRLCMLCGACDKDHHHILAHCVDQWIMCRECGVCFTDEAQFLSHFNSKHLANGTCGLCPNLSNIQPSVHAKKIHQLTAYKCKGKILLEAAFTRFFAGS